jgi:hypothetical protein
MARRGLERDQRAHAVADERSAALTQARDQAPCPIRERRDIGQRRTRRASVAGEVDGEHVCAMVGEPTALERPDAMVHPRPMQEHDQRPVRPVLFSACRGEYGTAIDLKVHGSGSQLFCAARSA